MKRILVALFSIYLAFAPVLANAASLGGWSIGGSSVQGASVVLSATKELMLNGAKKIANGTAKITPPPSSVAKVLAGGAAAVALDLAVKQLLGGVDYVLDPQNNQITYKQPATSQCYLGTTTCSNYCSIKAAETKRKDGGPVLYTDPYWGERWYCQTPDGFKYSVISGATTTPTQPSEPKTIPLTNLAQQVISMAQAGNPQAQQAIKAAADTIVAEAETDSTKARPIINQFEKTSTIETTEKSTSKSESTTTTNTSNPEESTTKTDTTTEFPVFCGWAPTICEAANVVIQKPQEWAENIKAAYDDALDYFKSETGVPEKTKDNINLPDTPITPKTVNVNWGQQCPEPTITTISFAGQTKDIQIIRYDFICEWAWVVKASVVALASIGAVFIIAGRKT